MDSQDFNIRLTEDVNYIEQVLKSSLPQMEGAQKIIFEAMEYNLLAGGKRLRPILMLLTYRLFGGEKREIIEPFLAAIEMIHTYSLIHDDLPAMDNDDYRRGRKTTHIVYGEAIGVLTGDALLNYAFEIATTSFAYTDYLSRTTKAFQILARKAGVFGMIGGQVVDMEVFDSQTLESLSMEMKKGREELANEELEKEIKELLDEMYHLKTGALLEASMMIGATLAGANESEIKVIEELAAHIGIAFQIQDDILDVISTTEELGKPVHSDDKNSKITYVTIMGVDKAQEEVKKHSALSNDLLRRLNRDDAYLVELINSLVGRRK